MTIKVGRRVFFTLDESPVSLSGYIWSPIHLKHSIGSCFKAGWCAFLRPRIGTRNAEVNLIRIRRGVEAVDASIGALREVAAPVTASVLTTIAAFPLA